MPSIASGAIGTIGEARSESKVRGSTRLLQVLRDRRKDEVSQHCADQKCLGPEMSWTQVFNGFQWFSAPRCWGKQSERAVWNE